MSDATRAEVCAAAVSDAFRGDGEIMASPFGTVASVGIRLAKCTHAPGLVVTDGICSVMADVPPVGGGGPAPVIEGWMPFRRVFDTLWSGKRHVMMGASQIDRYGNQNFASVGPYDRPRTQLLGMRGAPGNTISHRTSYWIPNHGTRVFVEKVDVVCGVGNDRAAALPEASRRFHHLHRVVTNLAVLDFETTDGRLRLRSVHPGVAVDEVVGNTGFELVVQGEIPETRLPTDEERRLLREVIDPRGLGAREVPG